MWKRDEAPKPASGQPAQPAVSGASVPRVEASHHMEKDIVNIGKSVVIKGELNGSEDLTVEGHVEGTIQLRDHGSHCRATRNGDRQHWLLLQQSRQGPPSKA